MYGDVWQYETFRFFSSYVSMQVGRSRGGIGSIFILNFSLVFFGLYILGVGGGSSPLVMVAVEDAATAAGGRNANNDVVALDEDLLVIRIRSEKKKREDRERCAVVYL